MRIKDEIREVGTGTNGRDLREVYDRTGLGVESLKELIVRLPVTNGELDAARQAEIASAIKRFNELKTRLADLGARSETAKTV